MKKATSSPTATPPILICLLFCIVHHATAFQARHIKCSILKRSLSIFHKSHEKSDHFSSLNNAKNSEGSKGNLLNSPNNSRRSFLSSSSSTVLVGSGLVKFPKSADADDLPPTEAATYAYRSAGLPSLRPLGLTKLLTRYEGFVQAPKGYTKRDISLSFDFPSDWLQLDKLGGGIQFVDQRNGDKLYVLRATLPAGSDLKSVNKGWFGEVIFNPKGDVVRSGVVVDGYRVTRSNMLVDCSDEESKIGDGECMPRRRLLLKYDTVTGSGVQTVERRGLVDVYQVGGDVYMMVTSSNAVKFEAKGSRERETVEGIVDSFKIG